MKTALNKIQIRQVEKYHPKRFLIDLTGHISKYLDIPGHHKQFPNHSRPFSNVFLNEFRTRNPDESAISVMCNSSSKKCLPSTWWSIKQDSLEQITTHIQILAM